ncbi:MAG TPA: nicotinamide riboside transporter PnuC [Cyclobacteriaceae bacterium]|nr:nicotinamide riboside transporter PnuC [Cyclobacteriaceae bacterium]
MSFFDIHNILVKVLGYPLSYLEFFATLSGFIAVWLSARANIWSWPIGIVNVTLFFFLVFQVQLYPDMFLQVFFFITNLMGWWRWTHPKKGEEDRKLELRVSWMPLSMLIVFSVVTLFATILSGYFAGNLHELFPQIFNKPSAFPFLDSFVMVVSIAATYLMIQKKIECWIAWLIADLVATFLYFSKGIFFVGLEFTAFCVITIVGFITWRREFNGYAV